MNYYFLNPTREDEWRRYYIHSSSYYLVPPTYEGFEGWIKANEIRRKDVDSLTSEWRKYGVDEALTLWLSNLKAASVHIKHLDF